jgi:Xaa-Pro aminopeptidase
VLSWTRVTDRLRRNGLAAPAEAHVIGAILRERRLRKVLVPENFPYALARALRRLRVKVRIRKGPFFPTRPFKTAEEVKKISAALMMAEVGLAEGIQALRNAKIGRNRRLLLHNIPLTSEKLRAVIDTAILQAGGLACHTIVAGGRQACDPHEPGHGPLRSQEPIIIDVFPRSQKTGYYGDITRTVVRGRASDPVRKLYHTVNHAVDLAFAAARAGVPAANVHDAVTAFFDRAGYATTRRNGRMRGFFHGTGHGLGLDIHEAPRLGAGSDDILQPGHVVTIEPGLYYPGVGGVRIEDVAYITPGASRNLTKFEKNLEV